MSLERIARQFDLHGRLASIRPITCGNVNDTYIAVFRTHFSEERVIIQQINHRVFPRPDWIMENMRILTQHCHEQLLRESDSADRIWQIPRIIPCKGGADCFVDDSGNYWRALTLIASAEAFDVAQSEEHAYECGMVLRQFHWLISGIDPALLRDTLPGYHETPGYLEKYDRIVSTDSAREQLEGSEQVRSSHKFIEARREFARVLQDAQQSGELQTRLIHGDPKVSNIMIDEDSGKGTAMIDLDTVKPGLIHYDFGDALRSLCNRAGEEAEELSDVAFDLNLCDAFVQGYTVYAKEFLTPNDRKYLYDSIRLITFELGLRFFQDHLAGDVYFKIRVPEQNLHRACVQFRLCESIEIRKRQIKQLLDDAFQ
ncbi:MAG: aminoglycoside phosphotransferase family protein [Verrucomicrobia bacterium]|nr:aminoglycoside phosphotransferase family protein [Verrucomicrobiota bacterium]